MSSFRTSRTFIFALTAAFLLLAPPGGSPDLAADCLTKGEASIDPTKECCNKWLEKIVTTKGMKCRACGGNNQSACGAKNRCKSGLEVGLDTKCHPCGKKGQKPCIAGGCRQGLQLDAGSGKCVPCGGAGQVVCLSSGCGDGLVVGTDGRCGSMSACGGKRQKPCGPPHGCDDGLMIGAKKLCWPVDEVKQEAQETFREGQNSLEEGVQDVLQAVEDAKCTAPPDPGGCPFTVPGGVDIFSRCTGPAGWNPSMPSPVGNAACDGVLVARELVLTLGESADKAAGKARARMDRIAADATEKVISSGFPEVLAEVAELERDIKEDWDEFANDPVCGSEAALEHLEDYFQSKVENAKAFAELSILRAKAGKERAQAIAEARNAKKAAKRLADRFASHSQATDRIESLADDLQLTVLGLGGRSGAPKSDVQTASSDGQQASGSPEATSADRKGESSPPGSPPANPGSPGHPPGHGEGDENCGGPGEYACDETLCDEGLELDDNTGRCEAPKLTPFVLSCAACGGGLVGIVGGIGGAIATCAETASAGCICGGIAGLGGLISSGVGCAATGVLWADKSEGYAIRWAELTESDSEEDATDRARTASALPGRVRAAGKDLPPRAGSDVQAVRRSMERSSAHLETYSRILRTEVAPLRDRLSGMRWSVFAGNVDQAIACWHNMGNLVTSVTGDALEGIEEIAEAVTEMEAVESTIASVNEAGDKASSTVEEKVTTAWEELHRKADRLHRRLLDVGYGARAKATETGTHLASMVNQPGKVDSLKTQLEATLREARFLVDDKVDEASEKFRAETEERLEAAGQKVAEVEARMRAGLEKVKQAKNQRASK